MEFYLLLLIWVLRKKDESKSSSQLCLTNGVDLGQIDFMGGVQSGSVYNAD